MANIEKTGQDILSQVAIMTEPLIKHLRELIENTRKRVASVVSDETTQLYWNVGYAINTFVLQGNRAEYGKQIVATVSRQLVHEYTFGTIFVTRKLFSKKYTHAGNIVNTTLPACYIYHFTLQIHKSSAQNPFRAEDLAAL